MKNELKLFLHPNKVLIGRYHNGADFLGYVAFPHFKILRTKTKKRLVNKIREKMSLVECGKLSKQSFNQAIQSYFGVLKHCNGYKTKEKLLFLVENTKSGTDY